MMLYVIPGVDSLFQKNALCCIFICTNALKTAHRYTTPFCNVEIDIQKDGQNCCKLHIDIQFDGNCILDLARNAIKYIWNDIENFQGSSTWKEYLLVESLSILSSSGKLLNHAAWQERSEFLGRNGQKPL